jgi:hypothetical protein
MTTRFSLLLGLACVAACAEAPPPPPPPEPPPAAEAPPELPPLNAADLAAGADSAALVPSPIETQRALEQAGIATQLNTLIPKHEFDMAQSEGDYAALRSGVVLADALLTVKTAPKADLAARLGTLQTGMQKLGGGEDVDRTLKDLIDRINADATTPDELLKEFDELSGAVIPELEFNGNKRIVPLIQAGSWLEGANLVAKAVKASGNPAAADTLLKQGAVVDYFIGYVKTEGSDKAPPAVTAKLEASLSSLKSLAGKAEPLAAGDIETVITVTDEVLTLL